MSYTIPYTCISHIGRCRQTNQDNFICDGTYRDVDFKPGRDNVSSSESQTCNFSTEPCAIIGCLTSDAPSLLGVFDGMGGEECGEEAALLAAKKAAGTALGKEREESLLEFCRQANAGICCYADRNGVQNMGTTAAMLAFDPEGISLCNIGDSKIFVSTEEGMRQISEDHLSIAPYGYKAPLSQYLGIPPIEMQIEPYTASRHFHRGDVYLICSDGLTDMVTEEEIAEILESVRDFCEDRVKLVEEALSEAAQQLLARALENGGKDNITIILCQIVPGKAA